MAGIKPDTPIPTDIKLHQKSRFVEFLYEGGERHELDFEFLRVFTPSAEARGAWRMATSGLSGGTTAMGPSP